MCNVIFGFGGRYIWILEIRVGLIVNVLGLVFNMVLLFVCYGLIINVEGLIRVDLIFFLSMFNNNFVCIFKIMVWIFWVLVFLSSWYLILFRFWKL